MHVLRALVPCDQPQADVTLNVQFDETHIASSTVLAEKSARDVWGKDGSGTYVPWMGGAAAEVVTRTAEDPEVVDALNRVSPSLAACYRQALRDIAQPDRESFVGPAAALRELVAFLLHDLAPDDAVTDQPGFIAEGSSGRPSMRQRVQFIVTKRAITADAIDRALEGLGNIVRATYARASKGTHMGPVNRREIQTLANYVHGILRDLLL